jgi:hypothetical protein
MKTTALWVVTIGALGVCSCSATETNSGSAASSPLKSFSDSGCKKEKQNSGSGSGATAAQAIVSVDYGAETAGLQCFAWETVGSDRLKIDLYNFDSVCGAKWQGRAEIGSTGALQLSLVNPGCNISKCGSCIYDWSFEVEGVDTSRPVPINVAIDTCPGERDIQTTPATLPVDVIPSGILCNYANWSALGWQAEALHQCGTANMPCSGTSMCQSGLTSTDPSCQGDLVVTDNGDAVQTICVKSCAVDEDCGTLGVYACIDGLCRPKNGW